jgi:hypothetical protein
LDAKALAALSTLMRRIISLSARLLRLGLVDSGAMDSDVVTK